MRKRHILQRLLLVIVIGGVAVVCLSSSLLAAIVGLMTAALVTIDMLAFSRAPQDHLASRRAEPETLNVDLSRRR